MSILENEVCSLELSNKLKELNINNESYFAWFNNPFKEKWEINSQTSNKIGLPAYTASELISLLPHRITLKEDEPFNSFTIYIKKSVIVTDAETDNPIIKYIYIINYECDSTEATGENAWLKRSLFPHNIWDENFSNALAKTLIYFIENGLMK